MRTGGKILIDQLVVQGCRTLFTVPGESFLPALDALFDEGPIRTIVCRHEGGAAMMAEASAKLTGTPGVAFVTRAPGAANAVSGVYVAHHDSTPMLLLVGLTRAGARGPRRLPGDRPHGTVRLVCQMGRHRARARAHPRARGARLSDRACRPSGSRRAGIARGRPARCRRCAGRGARRGRRAPLPRPRR